MIKKRLQGVWDLRYLLIFVLAVIIIISTGTVSATTYNCTNCSNCTAVIAAASSGDIVQLNTSINNYTGGTCIDFNGTDDIIFDCLGNTIDGDNSGVDTGIYLSQTGGDGTDNSTIRNCSITEFYYGVYFVTSSNNTLTNIIVNNNSYGLRLNGGSNNSILSNITANNNSKLGVFLQSSSNNTLINITITTYDNQGGLRVHGAPSYGNNVTNTVTVNTKLVQYFDGYYKSCPDNQTLDYNNTYSQIAFVGCDNITLYATTILDAVQLHYTNNSKIYNINSSNNEYGLYLYYSNNNTVTNITTNSNSQNGLYIAYSSNNSFVNITSNSNDMYGIDVSSSNNNTFNNITTNSNVNNGFRFYSSSNNILNNIFANYNDVYGLRLDSSDNNTFTNIIVNNNTNSGIYFYYDSNNTLTNITARSNVQYGIHIRGDSEYNVINNSNIGNNTNYGIYFQDHSLTYPQYNHIYNNFFNNTVNYYNSTNSTNYFNTTLTSETNIMEGPSIGGNYWAYPNGTGFSENCTDSEPDGICDSSYSLDGDNYDYLPLTSYSCVESWTCTAWSVCSGGTQTRTCTDSNDCGTTTTRPALSQSCTVELGGGGGITKDQPTEAHTWTEITPDQPVEMTITDPEIDLTKITITTTETVSGASLRVTKIKVVPLADLKIGMAGDTYQSFKIETTGINDENIESAIIEFKVNKTWVDEQGGSAGGIMLYRGGEKINVWNELQTTLIDSDDEYYYFSAITSGFSIFVVVIDLSACNNNGICERELGEDESNCPKDCGAERKGFLETMKSYLWTGIILVLVIAMVLVVLIVRLKKRK